MSSKIRPLSYSLAINEALHQSMAADPAVCLLGQGVKSPWYVGNTCQDLIERFGGARVIDTPVSENAITGCAVGAALAGMRPIVVHPRVDFLVYALDPIINEAANWRYMCGGAASVPVVIWAVVNRGGEQGAQHSQALHALFAHIPGLKVVMPATPYDAKGLMMAAIRDDNPVIFMDDRWLYTLTDAVPEEPYEVPIGKGILRRSGPDLTIAALSYIAYEAGRAAEDLAGEGIEADVIDFRTAKPLDREILLESVRKTGRLVVADGGWRTGGFAAEVLATAAESCYRDFKSAPLRVTLPDTPAPASISLEKAYYPAAADIVRAAKAALA